jgi:hypothetical protein
MNDARERVGVPAWASRQPKGLSVKRLNLFPLASLITLLACRATLTGAPHQDIERIGDGEQRPAIVAWMRNWIHADMGAEHDLFGDDCVLRKAPWENPQRKNW